MPPAPWANISPDRIVRHLLQFVVMLLCCRMLVTHIPATRLGLLDRVYPTAALAPSAAVGVC